MQGKPVWLFAAGGVLVLLIAFKFLPSFAPAESLTTQSSGSSQVAPPGSIRISIANSSTKQAWLHQAVREFNADSPRDAARQLEGKPIFVEIVQETISGREADYRSGSMIADTLSGKIKPTILSPADESWILKFQKEWQAINSRAVARDIGPTLVRTPLVIATWQSRATALGCWPTPEPTCTWERIRALAASPEGWGSLGRPEWGKFKFGYGYVGEANSGTFTAIALCTLGADKTSGLALADVRADSGCGEFMAGIERAKVHSGTSSDWLIEQMTTGGPEYLEAIVSYESDVILSNQTHRQDLREPLVSIYPQDGTIVAGHPFTILDGVPWVTAEQVAAARIFQKFLLSSDVQRGVFAIGLRPGDPSLRVESPIDRSFGANPEAKLSPIEIPDGQVIDQIIGVWHQVKKHSVLAVVFDKSGSMSGPKISAAIKGAQEFVRVMDRADTLIWRPFDNTIYPPVRGAGSEIGEELIARIGGTSAGGGTALYDAILVAFDELAAERRTFGDTRRYGIVVLSDGQDTNSRNSLGVLESRLRPEESDPGGIQIHTIAIGTDADENVLKKIANAAHGRYWKGNTAAEMVTVYKSIATYY